MAQQHIAPIPILFVFMFFVQACGNMFAPATPTPTLTFTALPSQTPTQIPTHTLTPTLKPTVAPTQAPNTSLTIRAWVDGDSQIIIHRDSLYWYQMGAAAPGRLGGALEATYINNIAWYPQWYDKPTTENRDCFCNSSEYVGIPSLSPVPQKVELELIASRGETRIFAQPNKSNDYTLIIELDDGPPPAADWYEIRINYYSSP